jgi:hypothetical protein
MKVFLLGLISSLALASNSTGHLNLLHLPAGTEIKFNMNYKIYPNFTFQKLKDECFLAFPKKTNYRRIKSGRTFIVHDLLKTFNGSYKPDHLIMDQVVALVLREGPNVSPLKVICKEDTSINEFMSAITRVASIKFPKVDEFEKPEKPGIYTPPFASENYHADKPGDHPYGGKLP